jgi:hypothetical protein
MGKLRRFYLVYFRKAYVRRQLALRKGECHQCARCCSFVFVCPMLTPHRHCRIYNKFRLEMCKSFPIDQRDIDEVALSGGTCGYRFEKDPLIPPYLMNPFKRLRFPFFLIFHIQQPPLVKQFRLTDSRVEDSPSVRHVWFLY